jgi:FkbM family methyltransferase
MRFRYPLKDKIAFYWSYFFLKTFSIWFEVKKPKLKMFVYEVLYSAKKIIDYGSLWPSPFKDNMIETKFGKFRIRPHTVDMSNVSPAFERRDMDYLLRLIDTRLASEKKILFLDIGADVGTFTVTVGNRFRDNDNIFIVAFEPADSSYTLLRENIRLNGLQDKTETFKFAVFNEDDREMEFTFNTEAPGASGLRTSDSSPSGQKVFTKTLDSLLSVRTAPYNVIVFKIDVEGVETEVLQGGEKILHSVKEAYLLVEDFVNPSIINYLENIRAEFLCKLTPYNSWWRIVTK